MTTRQNGFELGVALSFASVCLTLSATALAQDPAPPEEPSAGVSFSAGADSATGEASAEASAEATPPEPEPAAEPEPPPAEKEPAELDQSPAEPEEATSPKEPASESGTADVRSKTVVALGLEQLPDAAYPEIQTRGLKYGSLWRTFHGQQWPYLPQLGDEPDLRIGFSGYIWNDLSNTRITVDKSLAGANVNNQNRWTTQTRGILRMTPTYNAGDDWFAQGNGEFVVQGDMLPDPATKVATTTDDIWVRVGKWNLFDITVGRFQAWEIANHYGMALDWATLERSGAWIVSSSLPKPSDGYGLSYFWDRQNFLLGTYALHVYPTDYLRAELLGHIGAGNSSNAANPYQMDFRPSAIFDVGWLKVKGGWEYGKAIPQDSKQKVRDSKNGFGFAAQFVLAPYVEFGGSFARGFQDVLDKDSQVDLNASNTVQTVGGFLNASPAHEPLVFSFGAFWNSWEDFRVNNEPGPQFGKVDSNKQRLLFGAAQYTFWSRLFLKLVVSHAANKVEHFNSGNYTNNALSGRLRMELLF